MSVLQLVPDETLDFEAAVTRLRPRLQRYAARRLGDQHEAEELVQEALLRACRQGLRTEDELAAWCHVVISRLVLDRLRVRGRTVSVSDVPEGTRRHRDTADIVVARDEARIALDALDAIPARQASVLWAREVEGASYAEIGDRFAMTEPAVRSVLTRARKALRSEYATRGGTLPYAGLGVLAPWAALRDLSFLHRAASRMSTLGVAALGVTALGGLLLLPSPPATADSSPRTTTPIAEASAPVPPAAIARHATVAASRSAASAAGSRAMARTETGTTTPTVLTPLAHFCPTGTSGAGAGGSDCVPARTAYVYVTTSVHAGPVDVHEVGVRTNDYDCAHFPTTPVLSCRNGETR